MQLMRCSGPLVLALALAAGFARPAAAQTVTNTDIQRLQDTIYDASRDVTQLRARDAALASQLAGRARRRARRGRLPEGQAAQERADLAQRLRRPPRPHRQHPQPRARRRRRLPPLRPASASATTADRPPSATGSDRVGQRPLADPNEIPVGTEFDVRLQNTLSSKTAQVEDRFEATTMVDLRDERAASSCRPVRRCAASSAR